MSSLLLAISEQLKSLFLSTLLPVVVFVLLAVVLVLPLIPPNVAPVALLDGLDPEWKLAAMLLAVLVLTALLYSLNGAIIRFYEGYPWSLSAIGKRCTEAHQKRFSAKLARWRGMRTLLRSLSPADDGYGKLLAHWNQLGRELNLAYPAVDTPLLPTELGNVIRSFESYPARQYKMRLITVWPRLTGAIDRDYAVQITEAKSSLDFMLNGSFLCGLLALTICAVRLAYPVGIDSVGDGLLAALPILLLLLLSYGFYLLSISQASVWGMLVKGAVDLYRWDLLEKVGYRDRPRDPQRERQLWDHISQRWIFSDLATARPLEYEAEPAAAPAATRVEAQAAAAALELTRGASRPARSERTTVSIRIRNADAGATAQGVTIHETLPEEWLYEWGSACVGAAAATVSGINPYRFQVGDIGPQQEALLTYRALARTETPTDRRS